MYNPVFNHYIEIRYRFIYILYSILCAFITSYYYRLELMYLLSRPFLKLNQTLQSTDITEALSTTFKLCIYFSLSVSLLIYIYQYWSFLVPSRYRFERKKISLIIILLLSILCIETFFIYFYIFPKICQIFSSFQVYVDYSINSDTTSFQNKISNNSKLHESIKIIEMSPRIESTLSSSIRIYIILCLLFQIPLLFIFLFYFNYCNCFTICRHRKIIYFFLICFSALISPPDFFSQFFCLIIISFFFELSLWIGCLFFIKYNFFNKVTT